MDIMAHFNLRQCFVDGGIVGVLSLSFSLFFSQHNPSIIAKDLYTLFD